MRRISFWLSLGFVFCIPWENAVTVGEIGTLARVIGISAAAVWMFSCLIDRKLRRPHLFLTAAFLFILWNILSFYWSIGADETIWRILIYIQLGLMAWMLWDLYSTKGALRAALEAYILGSYIAVFSSIANYLSGQTISAYQFGRYTGANINAVELSVILSMGLPVSWYLATTSAGNNIRKQILKLINFAFLPLAIFSIMITGSRTALFTLVPALLYIGGSAYHFRPLFGVLFTVVFVGVILSVVVLIPEATVDRLVTVGDSIITFDLGGRGELWYQSMSVFVEHPLLGAGSGALQTPAFLNTVAHNTYLSILTELGLIGFLLFVGMLAIVAYQAAIQFRAHERLWITILSIWMIGCLSLSWELTKPTWLFLSMIIASGSLYKTSKHDETILG